MRIVLIGLMIVIALPFAARAGVAAWAARYTYSADSAPVRRVAIVFGAQIYASGAPSPMLADRIAAAADLYHTGRVEVLLLTGDNSTADYNEPGAMRAYAIRLGVPPDAIVLDYAGRRTYDSCYRARHIFGVTDAVLLTQQFHLPRALMTCRALGVDAVGVAADYQRPWGYSRVSLTYSRIREFGSTLVALVDVLRKPLPPIMGQPLPIFPGDDGA